MAPRARLAYTVECSKHVAESIAAHFQAQQKGDSETFVCSCGYKEKLEAFKNRRAKEGAGVSKRDVQKYLKKQQQQNDEPVNNAFAQALAGLKLDK